MSETIVSQTSSVGAAWPPTGSNNERMRGFCNTMLQSNEDVEMFAAEFESRQQEVAEHPSLSRLSIRTIASLSAIALLDRQGVTVEGALPIRGEDNLMVAYTAWNNPERTASSEHLGTHRSMLVRTVKDDYTNTKAKKLIASGQFLPESIDRFTPEKQKRGMIAQFAELYSAFGYDEKDVEEILLNPANTIAYVQDEEGIISTAMAEKATIEVEDFGQLHMAEITEAITHKDMRGRGYYAAICGFLTERLKHSDDSLDVIYGESNLAMEGLLRAVRESGRNFSYFDRDRLGVRHTEFGILQQNFKVVDGKETRPYNDFALSYVPLEK